MAWTTPKTWSVDELLTAANLNTHLRDNLNALKSPPSHLIERDNTALYSTTSTTMVPVDTTNLRASITTAGGDVWVHFQGTIHADAATQRRAFFDLSVDGAGARYVGQGYAGGYCGTAVTSTIAQLVCIDWLITGLAAGTHTFTLMYMTDAGTLYLHADKVDALVSNEQPAVLWAREVS